MQKEPSNLNPRKRQEAMKAYLRIKPSESSVLSNIANNFVSVKGQGDFTYDKIFDQQTSNEAIFKQIGDPLIQHSLQGFNTSVLAYGQTASGKTFTMKGDQQNQGMIPRAIRKLFSSIQEGKLVAAVTISYIEIYNQNIIDLLNSFQAPLDVHENYMKNVTITNLTEAEVSNVQEAMKYFEQGETRRKVASNNINMASSRSHTIFRINVSVVNEDYDKVESCINMVDLAGSEGVSRTKAEGGTKKEGENINKSILALTNVFRGMSEKQGYVNYRDSKLTRLLQSSFCSNSRSIVICTINPIPQNYQQTINTLKFGLYATTIKLAVKKNLKQNTERTNKTFRNRANDLESESQFIEEVSSEGRLRPDERIEFEQNKRMISQLREQSSEFRGQVKSKQKKIEYLELENHKLNLKLQNVEKSLEHYEQAEKRMGSMRIMDDSEKYHYETEIKHLKEQMNIMADRYDALNETYIKTLNNERYLVDRIGKYESQITLLKESTENQIQSNEFSRTQEPQAEEIASGRNNLPSQRPKTPIKVNPNILYQPRKRNNQSNRKNNESKSDEGACPLTIGSIVKLKACLIELKRSLFEANQEIAKLTEQKYELKKQIEELEDEKCEKGGGKYNISHVEGKQIKNLNIRIRKLKKELAYHQSHEKKLLKKLNEKNYKGLEELNEFNEWYLNRMSEEEEKKAQERDQALRNAGLILESIKKSNARKGNIEMESLNNQRPEDKAIIGRQNTNIENMDPQSLQNNPILKALNQKLSMKKSSYQRTDRRNVDEEEKIPEKQTNSEQNSRGREN